MNTVPQPRERRALGPGEFRTVSLTTRDVSIGFDCAFVSHKEGPGVALSKHDAIEAAKAILLAYDVPFKNAVKGAGVIERSST